MSFDDRSVLRGTRACLAPKIRLAGVLVPGNGITNGRPLAFHEQAYSTLSVRIDPVRIRSTVGQVGPYAQEISPHYTPGFNPQYIAPNPLHYNSNPAASPDSIRPRRRVKIYLYNTMSKHHHHQTHTALVV